MLMQMKYGKSEIIFDIDQNRVIKTLEPNERRGISDPLNAVKKALKNPVETPPLADLLLAKKPKDVTIVVNDITRPTPYESLLPPL